jgi:hypothetical protein
MTSKRLASFITAWTDSEYWAWHDENSDGDFVDCWSDYTSDKMADAMLAEFDILGEPERASVPVVVAHVSQPLKVTTWMEPWTKEYGKSK